MFKKSLSLTLCLLMALALTGCGKTEPTLSVDNEETSSIEEPTTYINPLTGENNLDKEASLQRSVAIMVNNLDTAQPVQTGLSDADIVYETEVEGGITRLLAVYQDLKSVKQIGTVRSARYAYIDLAAGHNAIYIHHGQDPKYAKPHLKDVDRVVLSESNGGKRLNNGLGSEHTLYAYGDKLWETIEKDIKTTAYESEAPTWVTFAKEDAPVALDFTTNTVTIPFSNSYKTTFKYNAETGRYTRYFNETERKDYNTKESVTVKNVFVLSTTISFYSSADKHRNISLTSGDGYYFTNGTYTKIKWSKGATSNGFTFTKEDGTDLIVNAGNSWVCIADKNTSQPVIG